MPKEVKEIMDSSDLAEYLGYTPRTIYKLIKEESLPVIRIRGQFRFKKDLVDSWLEERTLKNQDIGEKHGKG